MSFSLLNLPPPVYVPHIAYNHYNMETIPATYIEWTNVGKIPIVAGPPHTLLTDYKVAWGDPFQGNDVRSARFNPNYSKIVFDLYSDDPTLSMLRVINEDGSNDLLLDEVFNGSDGFLGGNIQWHPNGTKIYYSINLSYPLYTRKVCSINSDGTNKVELITAPSGGTFAWSLNYDATKIAYYSGAVLYVCNADGSSPVAVPNISGAITVGDNDESICWTRNSNTIVYGQGTNMYKINSDGTGKTQINVGAISYYSFCREGMTMDSSALLYQGPGSPQLMYRLPLSGSGQSAISPSQTIFNAPILFGGRVYFNNASDDLASILEDGSDYRVEVTATNADPLTIYPSID